MGLQLWLRNEKFCHHSCWTLPSICFVQLWFWQHLLLGRPVSLHFSLFLLFLIIVCFKFVNLSSKDLSSKTKTDRKQDAIRNWVLNLNMFFLCKTLKRDFGSEGQSIERISETCHFLESRRKLIVFHELEVLSVDNTSSKNLNNLKTKQRFLLQCQESQSQLLLEQATHVSRFWNCRWYKTKLSFWPQLRKSCNIFFWIFVGFGTEKKGPWNNRLEWESQLGILALGIIDVVFSFGNSSSWIYWQGIPNLEDWKQEDGWKTSLEYNILGIWIWECDIGEL